MDLGPPIAFTALEEGAPVYDPGGRRVGVVDQVLIEPPTHGIFERVMIHTVPLPGRHLRARPDQTVGLHERGVLLAAGAEALAEEQGHRHGGEEAHTPEPSLERLARRVVDRLVRPG